MIFSLAFAAPVLQPEIDPVQACVEQAGPVRAPSAMAPTDKLALVIGVPCHQDPFITPLGFATQDAERMEGVLSARGYQVHTLTTLVSRQALWDAISGASAALTREGELLIYYSGHGVLREVQGQLERFLVFSDSDLGDLSATGVSLTTLESRVQEIQASQRTIVQDSCYASGELGKGLGVPAGTKALALPAPALGPQDTRFYASRFYELATEDLELGGSVYTAHLVTALEDGEDLDGDGCIGWSEAHRTAARRTTEARAGAQHPAWNGRALPSHCEGPTHGVVVGDDLTPVEPGRVAGYGRVRAGEWASRKRRATTHWLALRPSIRVLSTGFATLGLEGLTHHGPVAVGLRAAVQAPGSWTSDTFANGGEVLARAGWMGGRRLRYGALVEAGALFLRFRSDPIQTAFTAAPVGRVQYGETVFIGVEGTVQLVWTTSAPLVAPSLALLAGARL